MANYNDRENYNQEVKRDDYIDSQGNTHTRVTKTTETPNNSYANGYVNGRNIEHNYQADRDNENAANGLIFGVVLTSLVGLIVGAFWYFNQNNAAVNTSTPLETPSPVNTVTATPQPQKTTVIERTREVPVVIPQQPVPSSATSPQPQINVTVPPQPSVKVTVPPATTKTQTPQVNTQPSPSSSATPQSRDESQTELNNSSSSTDNSNPSSNSSGQ